MSGVNPEMDPTVTAFALSIEIDMVEAHAADLRTRLAEHVKTLSTDEFQKYLALEVDRHKERAS